MKCLLGDHLEDIMKRLKNYIDKKNRDKNKKGSNKKANK